MHILLAIVFVAVSYALPFLDLVDPLLVLDGDNGFAASIGQSNKDSALCDYNTFRNNFRQFTSAAGLTSDTNYTNNMPALITAINDQLRLAVAINTDNGRVALYQICNAQRHFFQALGLQNWINCLMAPTLVANGWDRTNGFQADMFFSRLNYQCGAAYQTYNRRVDMFSVLTTGASDLESCTDQFIQNLNGSIGHVEPCANMEEYDECIGRVYGRGTGNDRDVAFTTCEASRIGNVITLPRCLDSMWACHVDHILP